MKEYRIGDFARNMGVTPDLLKHYEEQGLLQPSRSESGYRYYPFPTAMLLMECVKLRNFGLTLRESRELVAQHSLNNGQAMRRIDEGVERMRRDFTFREALIETYEDSLRWMEPLKTRETDWEVRWSRPVCFLPHTDGFEFLHDPRIYALLKSWMAALPVVKSTLKVDADGRATYGLLVEERMLRRLGLPENDIVEHIPSQRVFCFKFRAELLKTAEESIDNPAHPAFQTLRSLGLSGRLPYYRCVLGPADWQRDILYQHGYYAIPLQE